MLRGIFSSASATIESEKIKSNSFLLLLPVEILTQLAEYLPEDFLLSFLCKNTSNKRSFPLAELAKTSNNLHEKCAELDLSNKWMSNETQPNRRRRRLSHRRDSPSRDSSFENSPTDERFQQLKKDLAPIDAKVNKLECRGIQWRLPPKLKITRIRRSKTTTFRSSYTFCSRAVCAQYYVNHPTPPIFLKKNLRSVLTRLKLVPHDKIVLTCFDDRGTKCQQNMLGGKRWAERFSKRQEKKKHELPETNMQQPSLVDCTIYEANGEDDKNKTDSTRRSQRMKHSAHWQASQQQQQNNEADEDLKSESETSTNGYSPLFLENSCRSTGSDGDSPMVLDGNKIKEIAELRCHTDEKRRMRRRHWHLKRGDLFKAHQNKDRVGCVREHKFDLKMDLLRPARVVKEAILNKHDLGSGYFGPQRRSLRLISKVE